MAYYNPYLSYKYLPLCMPTAAFMSYGGWDVDPPKKVELVYRFLEEGEPIQDTDQWNEVKTATDWLVAKHVKWAFEGGKVAYNILPVGNGGGTYQFRRPIRMQDATHRYLDVGETIIDGDEFLSGWAENWYPTYATDRVVGSEKANQYTFGKDTLNNAEVLYRRQAKHVLKVEKKITADDVLNYTYLKAGEFTKEGDEVFIESCFSNGRWEKCKNGNIDAIVSKYQEDKKCYRRKIDHNFLSGDLVGSAGLSSSTTKRVTEFFQVAMLKLGIEELNQEVATLKDQLANVMAEVNELKASKDPHIGCSMSEKKS